MSVPTLMKLVLSRTSACPPTSSPCLAKSGITEPFDIQAATIPDALAGRDVCGRAPTGSGKTIAFGVPLVARIDRARKRQPTALILAPTRELTAQICQELEPLASARKLSVCSVYGGVGYDAQRRALNRGVDILVACPGRLADLLRQDALDLEQIQVVVVDEADRMADMGFLPEVRRLLDQTPDSRQTMLFSATLDGAIKVLTRDYQTQRGASRRRCSRARRSRCAPRVLARRRTAACGHRRRARPRGRSDDRVLPHPPRRRPPRRSSSRRPACARPRSTVAVRRTSATRRWPCSRSAGSRHSIATDVAARGIHVDGVACVVHYDMPEDGKAYLHRSGRTARAGEDGLVISFVGHGDTRTVSRMQRDLEIPAPMTPPDIASVKERKASRGYGSRPNKPLGCRGFRRGGVRNAANGRPRPRRRNGERSGAQGREAQARGAVVRTEVGRRADAQVRVARALILWYSARFLPRLNEGARFGQEPQHIRKTRPRDGQGGQGEREAGPPRRARRRRAGRARSSTPRGRAPTSWSSASRSSTSRTRTTGSPSRTSTPPAPTSSTASR